jgi:hypothetical protein
MRQTAMPQGKLQSAMFLSFIPLKVAQTVRPSRVEVEKRVDSILSKMTQEEKIETVAGINDFYVGGSSENIQLQGKFTLTH